MAVVSAEAFLDEYTAFHKLRGQLFRLSVAEHAALISQIAISNSGRGGRRKLPWAFTEHGAIQAANVLNSPRGRRTTPSGRLCSRSPHLRGGELISGDWVAKFCQTA